MLLDTSGLYSYFDKDDLYHVKAVKYFDASVSMLINDYVLAEFIPLCQTRGLNRKKTLEFVETLLTNPLVEIVWVNEDLHQQAFALLQERLDKTYSLCDAVSFIINRTFAF